MKNIDLNKVAVPAINELHTKLYEIEDRYVMQGYRGILTPFAKIRRALDKVKKELEENEHYS